VDNIKMGLKRKGCEGVDWFNKLRIGPNGGLFGHGNDPSDSISSTIFLTNLTDYKLLSKKPATWSYIIS
jgi:hypothetical protein